MNDSNATSGAYHILFYFHYFQSIHNSDIFEVRGVQIENIENRMVSQNSVNEITNFNLSCAVALYSLC